MFVYTYGCQMNAHDSETIAGVLSELGYEPADRPEDADMVVLNTCSVREKPHRKVFSKLGELRRLKQARPHMLLVVSGCMAQVVTDEIKQRAPFVDLIIGPREYASLAEKVRAHQDTVDGRPSAPTELLDLHRIVPEGLPERRDDGVGAWVTAMYGCANFCAYCVVPYARGPERSRLPRDVASEVQRLADDGFPEVTLLGQNVNAYGADLDPDIDFADLLELLNDVGGIERIRFTTSHPKDCSEKLLRAVAELEKICEHLHLPLQSGDDEVLRRMNRRYTVADYLRLIDRARELIPGVAVTTDLIVGFPGETPEQFGHTLDVVERIGFDQAFMFKYNDRPRTAAAQMPNKVPEGEKQGRLEQLVALQNEIGREKNRAIVGRSIEVLVEGPDKRESGRLQGRTRANKLVVFAGGPELRGRLVHVRTTAGYVWGFTGELDAEARGP
ncbi:MAG: tRNA (N6-isopentenyl adenosine(37)-C2)-methylthiotransferase MiaB [Armatimonadota bacterium]